MRPTLFRYAGEAAENNEEILVEMLALNDQINRTLQLYKESIGEKESEKLLSPVVERESNQLIRLENGRISAK